MKALLVRVGIDSSTESGGWNAPVNPVSGEFAYVPIVEDESKGTKKIRPGYETFYDQFKDACQNLDVKLPEKLYDKCAHLDPDFRYLTYGDEGRRRAQLNKQNLGEGDILAFYTSLESIKSSQHKPGEFIYALIGLYVLADKPKRARDIRNKEDWGKNAHTRREPGEDDIVFCGKEGKSGRLKRCIRIGEYHPTNRHYYLKNELQEKWGEPKAMSIQRGIHPLSYPERFCEWFENEKKMD